MNTATGSKNVCTYSKSNLRLTVKSISDAPEVNNPETSELSKTPSEFVHQKPVPFQVATRSSGRLAKRPRRDISPPSSPPKKSCMLLDSYVIRLLVVSGSTKITNNEICLLKFYFNWQVYFFVKGPFKCYVTLIFWKLDPHPPPRNANNIKHYTFVTLFSRKSDTPHPHLRYVTLEWPLILKCRVLVSVSHVAIGESSNLLNQICGF